MFATMGQPPIAPTLTLNVLRRRTLRLCAHYRMHVCMRIRMIVYFLSYDPVQACMYVFLYICSQFRLPARSRSATCHRYNHQSPLPQPLPLSPLPLPAPRPLPRLPRSLGESSCRNSQCLFPLRLHTSRPPMHSQRTNVVAKRIFNL